jgi:hypothetical protein
LTLRHSRSTNTFVLGPWLASRVVNAAPVRLVIGISNFWPAIRARASSNVSTQKAACIVIDSHRDRIRRVAPSSTGEINKALRRWNVCDVHEPDVVQPRHLNAAAHFASRIIRKHRLNKPQSNPVKLEILETP